MTTKTLNRPTAQLSVIPPGHWRCKWRRRIEMGPFLYSILDVAQEIPGTIALDENTYISPPRFLTRELADEDGRTYSMPLVDYVEAVYFDGEAP